MEIYYVWENRYFIEQIYLPQIFLNHIFNSHKSFMILRNDNDNLKHALKLSEFKSWLSFSRAMKILILLFVNIWEYICKCTLSCEACGLSSSS